MPNNWISHINIGGVQKDIRDNTIQVTDIPTASDDNLGRVVQYMGVTNGSYTHNYFYECVRNGFTYSWTPTSVQAGGGGGHTIEDSEGIDLTQRDTLQFGEGFLAEDDSTNEKTVISPNVMQSGDMDDVITPLPSVQPRYHKYSTEEQVIGEWIDGSTLYQKTFIGTFSSDLISAFYRATISHNIANVDKIVKIDVVAMNTTSPTTSYNGYYDTGLVAGDSSNVTAAVGAWCNTTTLEVIANKNTFASKTVYATIQYTKTTD